MALKLNACLYGEIPLADAYVRVDAVNVTKDDEFNGKLQADLDATLDLIDAINADPELDAEADGLTEQERDDRRAARTEKLGPLERKRDNIQERLAAHPNGAMYWVAKLSVHKAKGATKLPAPTMDTFKIKEVRLVPSEESPIGIALEYRNDPEAAVTLVHLSKVDPTSWAYQAVCSLPEISRLNPVEA
jgi:hypothetical protein